MILRRARASAPMSRGLVGRQMCACEVNSGEGMLAGGECVDGGCSSAKPRWSEVMIFLDVFLRRKGCCPEVSISSDERGARLKTEVCRGCQLRGGNVGRRREHGAEDEVRRSRGGRR